MISPFTKPGTKVVCIKLPTNSLFKDWSIKLNEVYTVAQIEADEDFTHKFRVILHEFSPFEFYGLNLFRRLELPECLTEILHSAPAGAGRAQALVGI